MGAIVAAGLTGAARLEKSQGTGKREDHTVDVTVRHEQLRADYVQVMERLRQTLKSLETFVRSTQDVLTSMPSEVTCGQVDEIMELALRAQQEWASAQALWAAMRGTWWD
jgi:hypothetical protein